MASRMTSVKLTVLAFVIIVTILALAPVTPAAQKTVLVPLFSITCGNAGKVLSSPGDVFIDEKNDEIYVLDAGNRRVLVFDMEGYCRYHFATPAGNSAPTSLVVNKMGEILVVIDGRIAVCDFRGNHR